MRSTHFFCLLALMPCVTCLMTRSSPAQTSPTTSTTAAATTRPTGPARWEKEIAAYEAADRANPPAKGGIVFTGSSTIRGWKTLASDFPDHHVINRGFGGSQIADATHFADRIIFPYAPRMVVLRAGGNDIHSGKSPERVFADYQAFVAKVRAGLPDAEIVFIGLAPAPSRWAQRDANRKLNQLVEQYTATVPGLKYVETYDTTVAADGSPREELFVKDRLHFNEAGYKLLAERVRPVLGAATTK
jgi:lysophospholipase L1-like esterase